MNIEDFFLNPSIASQKQYEALRSFYIDHFPAKEAAKKTGFSTSYFKKLCFQFSQNMKKGINPFFQDKKKGPKKRFTKQEFIDDIVALRKKNYSILDIKAVLESKNHSISLDTIDNILKDEGFSPLQKRTGNERKSVEIPSIIEAPKSIPLEIVNEEFTTEKGAAPLIFLPLIEELGIIEAIKKSGFPQTSVLNDISMIMSMLSLKILGNERLSHDQTWNFDRALGFSAGLNVLPKNGTISSYSYRVDRSSNRKFLLELCKIFKDAEIEDGEFNLDFKTIPHWGDESVLEKNWAGSRSKAMKSILSLIVQDPVTGFISFTNAEIKHRNQNDAVLEFVDFWKEGRGIPPKILIFDSKFTSYQNLNKLNDDKILFLTLRRRGKALVSQANKIPDQEWQIISFEGGKRKYKNIRVNDSVCQLRNYNKNIRQVIITGNGRENPTFLITNDFNLDVKELVKKYARRWLVEQEIGEQILFFHLNQPSSSIVVKVDFDLTLTLLAHNLYRILSKKLPGFEKCTVPTIFRNFLENGAKVKIVDRDVKVFLKKKSHLPILFELPWLKKKSHLSWMNLSIEFFSDTTS